MRSAFALALFVTGTLLTADDKDEIAKWAKSARLKTAPVGVRIEAVNKLGALGAEASAPLCDAMMDSELKVAKAALAALEKANPKLHEPLNRLALYEDAVNQLRALMALQDLGEKARPAFKLLESRMRSVSMGVGEYRAEDREDFAKRYFAILEQSGEEADLAALHKSLLTKPINYVKPNSLQWLVMWAGVKEDRRKELLPFIKSNVTGQAPTVDYIDLAGEYGALSKDLLPALKKLDFAQNEAVRQAAARAVRKIEGK